jgi:glycogen synthase
MTADAVGGVWGYSMELARALADYDVDFVIATMGALPTAAQRAEAAALENVRLVESNYRLEWMDEPWENVDRAGEWLRGLARETRPDLVHLNGYAHAELAWDSPHLIVAHSCVWSWWRAVHGSDPPPSWSTYFERVQRGLLATDLLIAPTWSMLDAIRTIYSADVPGRVIHNTRAGSFRTETKEPFVFSAGRLWDEAKNVAALARIAGSLPWPVRVAGDAGSRAVEAGGIEMLGRLDAEQLAGCYARASIYCHPALYEPFGLTTLEAALSGCALVLADISSLHELWAGAALLVPPGDDNALRNALVQLIDDAAMRRRIASLAVERARMFAPQNFARRYYAAYCDLLGSGRSVTSMTAAEALV